MSSKILRTTCARDCPDACGMLVEIEEGRIRSLRGDPDHPITQGYLCYRTNRYPAKLRSSDRILKPRLRIEGVYKEIDWDQAFEILVERLKETLDRHGAPAIAEVRGGGSLGLLKPLTSRFFRALGAVTEFRGDVCSGAGSDAQILDFGISDSHDFFDIENSRRVWLWGKNLGASWIHMLPVLRRLVDEGMDLRYLDPMPPAAGLPRHERTALRPGGDCEMALGIALALLDLQPEGFEERLPVPVQGLESFTSLCRSRSLEAWARAADVDAALLRTMAEELLDGPVAMHLGWGMQRRRRGGLAVRCVDALAALSGNLGVAGGGSCFYYQRRGAVDKEIMGEPAKDARFLAIARMGQEILEADPPLRFLWIDNMNPVNTMPDSARVAEAMEAVDFTVMVDCHENDSTRHADLVLPCTTFLEEEDLVGAYGHHWMGAVQEVVPRPEGVKTDLEIVQELAERMGMGSLMRGTAAEWGDRILRRELREVGFDRESMTRGARRRPDAVEVLFADGRVPTKSGKVELVGEADYREAPVGPTDHPIWLFTNSHRQSQASQWARPESGSLKATLHPDAAPGHVSGDVVDLVSPLGRLEVVLVLDPKMRPDCVSIPKCGSVQLGRSGNTLIEAVETDLGGGAAYLDTWVRIEKEED